MSEEILQFLNRVVADASSRCKRGGYTYRVVWQPSKIHVYWKAANPERVNATTPDVFEIVTLPDGEKALSIFDYVFPFNDEGITRLSNQIHPW